VTSCLTPFASERFLTRLDGLFARALEERTFSGASLLVGKPDRILFHKTWGQERRHGDGVDGHTLFDLASLTKPLLTVPLCMRAVSEGRLSLDDTLSRFFPAGLLGTKKKVITIRHILSHSSGIPAYEPFYRELIALDASQRPGALLTKILQMPLLSNPGTASCYSDLGFLLLNAILEKIYDKPFDHIASELLLEPLQLDLWHPSPHPAPSFTAALGFCPLRVPTDPTLPAQRLKVRKKAFVATEYCPWRKRLLVGEVHDENAYCLGGVAGHAGLFGTAHGVYRLLMFLWQVHSGSIRHSSWGAETVKEFWEKPPVAPASSWLLGFDTPSPPDSSAGTFFSPHSVGHLGFTGTSFWFDLSRETLVILLTNRVYPTRENERLKSFRPQVHNLVMERYIGASRD
jgi:serine-type D-Ala-D-Ala carboxypeptidase